MVYSLRTSHRAIVCGRTLAYRVGKRHTEWEKRKKIGSNLVQKKSLVMHEQLNMTNEIGGVLLLTGHQH